MPAEVYLKILFVQSLNVTAGSILIGTCWEQSFYKILLTLFWYLFFSFHWFKGSGKKKKKGSGNSGIFRVSEHFE